jgi:hypothetical protein
MEGSEIEAEGLGQRPFTEHMTVNVLPFNTHDPETKYEAIARDARSGELLSVTYGPTPSIAEVRARESARREMQRRGTGT